MQTVEYTAESTVFCRYIADTYNFTVFLVAVNRVSLVLGCSGCGDDDESWAAAYRSASRPNAV